VDVNLEKLMMGYAWRYGTSTCVMMRSRSSYTLGNLGEISVRGRELVTDE